MVTPVPIAEAKSFCCTTIQSTDPEGVPHYTSVLNIIFLVRAAGLLYRLVRTGGISTLKTMGGAPDAEHQDGHHEHPGLM